MTSFGKWVVAGSLAVAVGCGPALSTSPVHAAAPPAVRASARSADAIPPFCALQVRDAIAHLWSVPVSSVELAFGKSPSEFATVTSAPMRLTGRGIDGWFVAQFDAPSRPHIAVRVRAGVRDTVLVAAHAVASGATLTASDVARDVRVHWGAPRAAAVRPAPGWTVRRALAAGDEVTTSVAAAPHAIESGEQVTVVWRTGSVSVTQPAVALTNARWGEMVRVRLNGRGDRVVGRAVDRGVVAIAEGEGTIR